MSFFKAFFCHTNTHRRTQRHLTQRHSVDTLSYFKLIEDNDNETTKSRYDSNDNLLRSCYHMFSSLIKNN